MPHIHLVTVSDRATAGTATDRSGPHAAQLVQYLMPGWTCTRQVVSDGVEPVQQAILQASGEGADVVLTLGGTGVTPRDLTPEATAPLLVRQLEGITEMLRREAISQTPFAVLSRGVAGIIEQPQPTCVVNIAGSPHAADQAIRLLAPILTHLVEQLAGTDHSSRGDEHHHH